MRGDGRMSRRGDDELKHGNNEVEDFYKKKSMRN